VLAVSGQWLAVTEIHPGIVETVKRGVGIIGAACWGVWLFGEKVKPWQLLLMLLIIVATAGLALY
jgi:multidrug transporter EmrE-like cation transporter